MNTHITEICLVFTSDSIEHMEIGISYLVYEMYTDYYGLIVRTDLGIIAHRGRQQGEGILHCDPSLDDVLTQSLQPVLAV